MFTTLTPLLIALALLVTVPVALRALSVVGTGYPNARWVAAISLVLPKGWLAGALAGAWLFAASFLLWQHRRASIARMAALAWLPAAAAWLVADRLGVRPLGVSPEIVALTAAHFHHAGFGVSVMLAAVGAHRGLVVHQMGMVLVAAGIAADGISAADGLEPLGAACIVVALAVWTAHAWRRRGAATGWRRAAFTVSAVAWLYPMALALAWALAPLGPHPIVTPFLRTLHAMVAQHGAVNALAVVLLGVAALTPPRGLQKSVPAPHEEYSR